jgi:hypothetical protein
MNIQRTNPQPITRHDFTLSYTTPPPSYEQATSTATSQISIRSDTTPLPSYEQAISIATSQDYILSYTTPPPRYEEITRSDNLAKFKDLQSRAIEIIAYKKPINQIACKPGSAFFKNAMESAHILTGHKQGDFIRDLSKYCISDLCHNQIIIYKRQWKNNFLTTILNISLLKKHIFRINSNKFNLNNIKAINSDIKQQISIMLLDEYNSGDVTGLIAARNSLDMAKILHQTSLTTSNQLMILDKFKMYFTQIMRPNLNNYELIGAFKNITSILRKKLNESIQQQETLNLDNEFYKDIFQNYFHVIKNNFL